MFYHCFVGCTKIQPPNVISHNPVGITVAVPEMRIGQGNLSLTRSMFCPLIFEQIYDTPRVKYHSFDDNATHTAASVSSNC